MTSCVFLFNSVVYVCVCVVQVVGLMGVDLLRQQQRWKDGLQDLRTGFATLESQVRMVLISQTQCFCKRL